MKISQGTSALTVSADCGCNKMFTILGNQGGAIQNLIIKLGSQGSCAAAIVNALAVIISISLKAGVPADSIAKLCKFDRGQCHMDGENPTCIAALGNILAEYGPSEESDSIYGVPMSMDGKKRTMSIGCGLISVHCFNDSDSNLREVSAELAQTNTCANTITKMIGKLITLALCFEVSAADIAAGLRGIRCPAAKGDCTSCLDAIGRALQLHEGINPDELANQREAA
jgi:hypothetical protein